jgi:uncharacterized tellurite resistance protein B-like protein
MTDASDCVRNLTKEQKIVFVQVFVHLAEADGNFDDDEKAYVLEMAKTYGLTEKDGIFADIGENELIEAVRVIRKSRRAALELIKEMCILAHADNDSCVDEAVFIGKIGNAMGIESEKVEQINNWVIDRFIWLEEEKIIFEEAV